MPRPTPFSMPEHIAGARRHSRALRVRGIAPPKDWRNRAACLGAPPEAMFALDQGSIREARALCESCPVLMDCLATCWQTERSLPGNTEGGTCGAMTRAERQKAWMAPEMIR